MRTETSSKDILQKVIKASWKILKLPVNQSNVAAEMMAAMLEAISMSAQLILSLCR